MATGSASASTLPEKCSPQREFVVEMQDILKQAHETLRRHQPKVRQDDQEEPLWFAQRDKVWFQNKRRQKGDTHKLQQKLVGLYQIIEAYTHKIEKQGQSSIKNEVRLNLYHYCTAESEKKLLSVWN